MSHWKAYAAVSEVAEADLRDRLIAATEALYVLGELLGCHPDNGQSLEPVAALEREMSEAIDELRREHKESAEAIEQAEDARDEAERRLQESTEGAAGLTDAALLARVEAAEAARETMRATCEKLVESYSDLLAMARKFTTAAQVAGVPTRHVRSVKRKNTKEVRP